MEKGVRKPKPRLILTKEKREGYKNMRLYLVGNPLLLYLYDFLISDKVGLGIKRISNFPTRKRNDITIIMLSDKFPIMESYISNFFDVEIVNK